MISDHHKTTQVESLSTHMITSGKYNTKYYD